jgi:hypothetical protein
MSNAQSIERMQVVVDSLRDNPDIVVVGGYQRTYLSTGELPDSNENWSHTLDLYTHPKDPLYTAEELNKFTRLYTS